MTCHDSCVTDKSGYSLSVCSESLLTSEETGTCMVKESCRVHAGFEMMVGDGSHQFEKPFQMSYQIAPSSNVVLTLNDLTTVEGDKRSLTTLYSLVVQNYSTRSNGSRVKVTDDLGNSGFAGPGNGVFVCSDSSDGWAPTDVTIQNENANETATVIVQLIGK